MALTDLMKGYAGTTFPLPKIAGTYKGGLIICGDAACVWGDLERFGCASRLGRGSVRKDGFDFMTVNRLVETFPGEIEHCYSNEPQLLDRFVAARREEYRKEFGAPRHTHSCNKGAMWRWPWGGHGSSGLGAALVAVGLGYEQIVLCGMPLDNSPHNGEPPWRECRFDKEVAGMNQHWKSAMEMVFDGKVKSMSGRTMKWLGNP